MMRSVKRPKAPLFLPRPSYRLRRLADAARLLPLLGGFLWLLPVLWGPGETPARDTAHDGIYLFVVWAVLIGCAALLAPGLAKSAGNDAAALHSNEASDPAQDDR